LVAQPIQQLVVRDISPAPDIGSGRREDLEASATGSGETSQLVAARTFKRAIVVRGNQRCVYIGMSEDGSTGTSLDYYAFFISGTDQGDQSGAREFGAAQPLEGVSEISGFLDYSPEEKEHWVAGWIRAFFSAHGIEHQTKSPR